MPAPAAPTAVIRLSARPGGGAPWRTFRDPVRVVQALTLAEVQPALREVEAAAQAGLHAVGLVAYEAAPAFEPALPVRETGGFPLVWFALFDGFTEEGPDAPGPFTVGDWTEDVTREAYAAAIAEIRGQIQAGNTYQVNHTARLHAAFAGDDRAWFAALSAAQPTPYGAYLNLGRWRVLSVSPELFFRLEGGVLTTRPMKGTTPRGRTEAEDRERAAWLPRSVKNRAENVMIVDLLRNDLGRVAAFGSVQVTELCRVERLPTLLTMTSTVQARVRAGLGLTDVFAALFPCGSVTGAPKINTMRLIHALEPQARRVYCGAVGVVEPGGDAVFNVPIRTVLLDTETGVAEYGAGGGITWDSEAGDEFAELQVKARVLTARPPAFELLETLRLEAGTFRHLPGHLARMAASARYFAFPWEEAGMQAELGRVAAAHPAGVHRVRLRLARDGGVTVQVLPLGENPPVVPAALARTPVDSGDVFLFHKTTHRAAYEVRAAEVPPGHEALLTNERGELTEFTTGNVVLRLDGRLVTPPVTCGLLAGVERADALARGQVTEQVLTPADLRRATEVWHVNSLRGWRQVQMERSPAGPARESAGN